jgi:prepilin-type N-terminal cleavage/methylation domain-containing protein
MPVIRARRRPRRGGYTLIELIIVIAILGIAGAVLVPHLVGRDILAAQAAVRLVIADLSFAQSDALAHQGYRRVQFYDDGRGYCILDVDETTYDDSFTDPDDPPGEYVQDPLARGADDGRYIVDFTENEDFEGISIESVSLDGGNAHLVYDPLGGTVTNGLVPGTGGTIVLASPNVRYEITIAPFTGKLTVRELN